MVFYLKDATHYDTVWSCILACKYIYSIIKNDKVNTWSQEIHAITPYIDFGHM